jgi:hypothetical protein
MTLDLAQCLDWAEPLLCIVALTSLIRSRSMREYGYLCGLLGTRLASLTIGYALLKYGRQFLGATPEYVIYFYCYWTAFAVESILMLVVICSMYRLAMAPLKGLQGLGMLVFTWVAAISVLVALGSSFVPHTSQMTFIVTFVSQMQRTQSILTLCLLLFVCFAIRPMGLSYRSRIFGVSLGLGVMATTNMIQSAWIGNVKDMYGIFSDIGTLSVCLTFLTWTLYFALPEPKRRIITLPTTSPFLRWNQISEILGDDPGHVAIGGLPPEMLAPAEIEVMRRASIKMNSGREHEPKALDAHLQGVN